MALIQAILFDRDEWATQDARKWMKRHRIDPIKKVHKTENFLRYRLANPKSFKRFRTLDLGEGIKIIIAS